MNNRRLSFAERLERLPKGFLLVTLGIILVGLALLYSAAGGSMTPWAARQMVWAGLGAGLMMVVALVDIRWWFRLANLAYLGGLGLLVLVFVAGTKGGLGAQRWLSFGGFTFQPSELMKICLVLALARYYQRLHVNNLHRLTSQIFPAILIGLAAGLVLIQPNLGTAVILTMLGIALVFMAGVSWKKFLIAGLLFAAALPVVWSQMHGYQKERVYTFLDPERDPLGAGYNIIQSKIAIGSGGFFGKGFVQGTQSQLEFVPEHQTDFIFAIAAEEFGFLGSMSVLLLYALLMLYGLRVAMQSENLFGSLAASGVMIMLFLHVFINTGMVMGLLPVVGVPLPLLSYGGSSILSTLIGVGFVLNAAIYRDVVIYDSDG